jgi:hypothetical protein
MNASIVNEPRGWAWAYTKIRKYGCSRVSAFYRASLYTLRGDTGGIQNRSRLDKDERPTLSFKRPLNNLPRESTNLHKTLGAKYHLLLKKDNARNEI